MKAPGLCRAFFVGGDWGLGDILPLGVQVEGLSPEAAELSYLTEFRHLMGLRQ